MGKPYQSNANGTVGVWFSPFRSIKGIPKFLQNSYHMSMVLPQAIGDTEWAEQSGHQRRKKTANCFRMSRMESDPQHKPRIVWCVDCVSAL